VAVLIVIVIFVLIGAVVLVVGAPLRAARERPGAQGDGAAEPSAPHAEDLAELRAEREAKYREIRDAEMDFRTGKLSEQDYRALDAELRGEALRVLDALRALGEEPGSEQDAAEPGAGA